jgi:hypothetical protein
LSWVLERDPGVAEVIDAHDGTEAYWSREGGSWRRLEA